MRPRTSGPTGIVIARAGVLHRLTADETVGRVHRDAPHGVLAEVLGDFDREVVGAAVDRLVGEQQGRVNLGQLAESNATSTTGPMTWTTRPMELGE